MQYYYYDQNNICKPYDSLQLDKKRCFYTGDNDGTGSTSGLQIEGKNGAGFAQDTIQNFNGFASNNLPIFGMFAVALAVKMLKGKR